MVDTSGVECSEQARRGSDEILRSRRVCGRRTLLRYR